MKKIMVWKFDFGRCLVPRCDNTEGTNAWILTQTPTIFGFFIECGFFTVLHFLFSPVWTLFYFYYIIIIIVIINFFFP